MSASKSSGQMNFDFASHSLSRLQRLETNTMLQELAAQARMAWSALTDREYAEKGANIYYCPPCLSGDPRAVSCTAITAAISKEKPNPLADIFGGQFIRQKTKDGIIKPQHWLFESAEVANKARNFIATKALLIEAEYPKTAAVAEAQQQSPMLRKKPTQISTMSAENLELLAIAIIKYVLRQPKQTCTIAKMASAKIAYKPKVYNAKTADIIAACDLLESRNECLWDAKRKSVYIPATAASVALPATPTVSRETVKNKEVRRRVIEANIMKILVPAVVAQFHNTLAGLENADFTSQEEALRAVYFAMSNIQFVLGGIKNQAAECAHRRVMPELGTLRRYAEEFVQTMNQFPVENVIYKLPGAGQLSRREESPKLHTATWTPEQHKKNEAKSR